MEKGKKLPAPDFCNKKGGGKANPIYGKGVLGNQFSGRMYYNGSDKEEFVTLVQTMLEDLGYDVGSKGADGKFGNDTEKAVKEFQKRHEDWGGEKLNVDGLVGPETSDALNRAMVGMEGWYIFHQTEKELTGDYALLTATAEALRQPVPLDVDGVEKGRVVITSYMRGNLLHISFILYAEEGRQPLANCSYKLYVGDGIVEGTTDHEGLIEHDRMKAGDYLLEIAGGRTYVPAISCDSARHGWMVLGSRQDGTVAK